LKEKRNVDGLVRIRNGSIGSSGAIKRNAIVTTTTTTVCMAMLKKGTDDIWAKEEEMR
jgi:hypothetical protein